MIMSFSVEVREGEMKQLDVSVLHALDLDVPQDILLFSVVKPPHHGSIITLSSERKIYKRQEAAHQSPVVDFSMTDLSNGTFHMSVLLPSLTHKTQINIEIKML